MLIQPPSERTRTTLHPHPITRIALSVSLFAAGGALASELSGSSGLDAGVGVGAEVGAGTQAGDSTIGPGAEPGTAPGARTLPEGDVLDGDEVDELDDLDGVGEDDDTSERIHTPHDRDGTLNAPADMDRERVTPDPHDEPGTSVPDDSGIRGGGGAGGSGSLNTDGGL